MKITGGKFRNHSVLFKDSKTVRPTSSKMREALFSMIGQDLSGLSFLDAFGGSGIMGLEAFSRGAAPVCISEQKATVAKQITTVIKGITSEVEVKNIPAEKSMKLQVWDIIFLDPPYRFAIQPILDQAFVQADYLVIAETSGREKVVSPKDWEIWKQKQYGTSQLTIFKKN